MELLFYSPWVSFNPNPVLYITVVRFNLNELIPEEDNVAQKIEISNPVLSKIILKADKLMHIGIPFDCASLVALVKLIPMVDLINKLRNQKRISLTEASQIATDEMIVAIFSPDYLDEDDWTHVGLIFKINQETYILSKIGSLELLDFRPLKEIAQIYPVGAVSVL